MDSFAYANSTSKRPEESRCGWDMGLCEEHDYVNVRTARLRKKNFFSPAHYFLLPFLISRDSFFFSLFVLILAFAMDGEDFVIKCHWPEDQIDRTEEEKNSETHQKCLRNGVALIHLNDFSIKLVRLFAFFLRSSFGKRTRPTTTEKKRNEIY